ncbi:MAG: hypothetical protein LBL08_02830 [Candidatus Nomurabacteria bacterium]|jgi:uncharacterized protein with HEPN domain|nr:hypothetical protein [Candidatus Nomurabacteria bacterium]
MGTETLMILGSALLIGLVIILAVKLTRGRSGKLNVERFRAEWLKIENSIDNKNSMTFQMAVLSADKLLDKAMRELGMIGENMGDRLKNGKNRFSKIDAVWTAHKMRNRIAHETDVALNFLTLKKIMMIYKRALKDLGAI